MIALVLAAAALWLTSAGVCWVGAQLTQKDIALAIMRQRWFEAEGLRRDVQSTLASTQAQLATMSAWTQHVDAALRNLAERALPRDLISMEAGRVPKLGTTTLCVIARTDYRLAIDPYMRELFSRQPHALREELIQMGYRVAERMAQDILDQITIPGRPLEELPPELRGLAQLLAKRRAHYGAWAGMGMGW